MIDTGSRDKRQDMIRYAVLVVERRRGWLPRESSFE